MKDVLLSRFQGINSVDWHIRLRGIKRGLERECLRVDQQKKIARTPHPLGLGASLTHPLITTDYSEALLEFITSPTAELNRPLIELTELHQFTYSVLQTELLWSGSMPCLLPEESNIPIAQYGDSNLGKLKHIYRQGLGYRYGRAMQMIAGVHYNFSLSDQFWQKYYQLLQSSLGFKDFVSEQYLGMIRNCFRFGWLLPMLFGASPAASLSFFKKEWPHFEKMGTDTLFKPDATSLRLSDLGYHNRVQSGLEISYNSFSEFIQSIEKAVKTSVPEYKSIGIEKEGVYRQLSESILQIEDEHYALFRPKRVALPDERMLRALKRDGIEYIEIRALDVNPFSAVGIEQETLYLLDSFLLMCLLMESPPMTSVENERIIHNFSLVVEEGRKMGLVLLDGSERERPLQEWALELLDNMLAISELLDKSYGFSVFSEACIASKERILNPALLPSAKMLQGMTHHQDSYINFAWDWSLKHRDHLQRQKLPSTKMDYYRKLTEESLLAQDELERHNNEPFIDYLHRYLA